MTPDELARSLGIDPKTLRAWLRRTGARSQAEHGQRWVLNQRQIDAATAHFSGRTVARTFKAPGLTATAGNRDEGYVIDLCDEVLGELGRRQHCFPWLLGDPGQTGARRALPVDAYYERHGLVVEYQERQHSEPTPFFDRRNTISGVGRGVQRRMYDERREQEIPAHGLRLVIVTPADLDADNRGRLRRNPTSDRVALTELLDIRTQT